ncbi:hypothetical protein GCM10023094_48500 [Rhodococcus olei]|uniref:Uncharacterized protein n=1 Tax=Rhodococcus olei TaxID=2161675 RepID=A0ABP8PKQ7_9NOCA
MGNRVFLPYRPTGREADTHAEAPYRPRRGRRGVIEMTDLMAMCHEMMMWLHRMGVPMPPMHNMPPMPGMSM